ncbi:hypothetical protein NL676_009299 [Syzygium grande]|nr:hypothetical protein NL676_009299 [Syzygium grande]
MVVRVGCGGMGLVAVELLSPCGGMLSVGTWANLVHEGDIDDSRTLPPLPPRLVTDDDLKEFYEAMKVFEVPNSGITSTNSAKWKSGYAGSLDTEQYGRGNRAREHLPSFARKHLKDLSGDIKLQLPDVKQWPVRCISKRGKAKISRGEGGASWRPAPARQEGLARLTGVGPSPANLPLGRTDQGIPKRAKTTEAEARANSEAERPLSKQRALLPVREFTCLTPPSAVATGGAGVSWCCVSPHWPSPPPGASVPGFVQVDHSITPGMVLPKSSSYGGQQFEIQLSIDQDLTTNNWWLKLQTANGIAHVGYWPAELLPEMKDGAELLFFGGGTSAFKDMPFPPMGSGYFPDKSFSHACYIRQIHYTDRSKAWIVPKSWQVSTQTSSKDCYGVAVNDDDDYMGYTLLFGGPGGYCGA